MPGAKPESVNGLLITDENSPRNQCGISDFSTYSIIKGSHPRRIMPAKLPTLEVAEQYDEGDRMDGVKRRESKL